MDIEQACIVLGLTYEETEELAEEVGADRDAITPANLLAMAALRDEEEDEYE